ncbi:helix-turn-helix domain-containing protein [Acidiphilium sp. JA12-A1]|uniref:helix-turn-helix domain-containing protein n=1 Tax=Acidiphilium sp. JA12-A1 TaxID=1464546 RepID=UPI001968282B
MGQPLSMDLRRRLLAAIDEGMSCRAAAARFGVAPATAIRWRAQRRDTGSFAPKPQGATRAHVGLRNGGRTFSQSGKRVRTSRLQSCAWR